jgi:hypothetical protein
MHRTYDRFNMGDPHTIGRSDVARRHESQDEASVMIAVDDPARARSKSMKAVSPSP